MTELYLQLFGGFQARREQGKMVEVSVRKGRGLLAYLALQPSLSAPRDRLASLLWSDRGDQQARSSLRQTLAVLRKELGEGIVGGDDERVELRGVESDVAEFASQADLRKAVELYRGEFLADAGIGDPAFEEWLGVERRRLRDCLADVLEKLIPQSPVAERVAHAKRLVGLDPLREASHATLMTAYADTGDRAQALAAYGAARDVLKKELGVAPGAELEALRGRLAVESNTVTPGGKLTIAILPFANHSGDPSRQYLSDGLTEDLITLLARSSELSVVSRSSAFRLTADADSGEAARTLGAQYVVKGTARASDSRLIVSCQLLEGASSKVLWSERYDRQAADIFSVLDEVAVRIVTALGSKLVSASASSAARKPTASWSAYDYFLKGRDLCNSGTEFQAEPYFAKAVELDPGFALAHAWRAIGFLGKSWKSGEHKFMESAYACAERAIALDSNEAMAHYGAAVALDYLGERDKSRSHFFRAMELNPLDVSIQYDYANLLFHENRQVEAIAIIETVLKRDPFPPVWAAFVHGTILFALRRFADSIRALDNGNPYGYMARAYLASAHAHLGNAELARRNVAKMVELEPKVSFQILGTIHGFPDGEGPTLHLLFDGLRKAGFDR